MQSKIIEEYGDEDELELIRVDNGEDASNRVITVEGVE